MPRTILAVLICVGLLAAALSSSPTESTLAADPPALEDLIFVTDALSAYMPGCEAISAIDSRTGDTLARGE